MSVLTLKSKNPSKNGINMYIFIVSMAVIVQLYVFMQSSVLLSYHLKFVILTRSQGVLVLATLHLHKKKRKKKKARIIVLVNLS